MHSLKMYPLNSGPLGILKNLTPNHEVLLKRRNTSREENFPLHLNDSVTGAHRDSKFFCLDKNLCGFEEKKMRKTGQKKSHENTRNSSEGKTNKREKDRNAEKSLKDKKKEGNLQHRKTKTKKILE